MSLQDQFEHARLPIKPLPYENHNLAQQAEFMIDYTGNNPSYHLYIVDPENKNNIIDITSFMVREAFGSSITVHIDGIEEPMTLHDLMNFIYKRFVYPEKINRFNYAEDRGKLLDPNTRVVLLQDVDNIYQLPVTRADAVFDTDGHTIQERLDHLTRVGFANDYVTVDVEDQNTFTINYPFLDYPSGGNYVELRAGTVFIDKTRYSITNNRDEDGHIYSFTVRFFNDTFEIGRRIDALFIYNASDVVDGNYQAVNGGQIANGSIPTVKLEKVSDSFTTPDSSCLATSKALVDMYDELSLLLESDQNRCAFALDIDTTHPNTIECNIESTGILIGRNYIMLTAITGCGKHAQCNLNLRYAQGGSKTYALNIPGGVGAGRMIKFILNDSQCKVVHVTEMHLGVNRYICTAISQQTEFSFANLSYDDNSLIKVYRNGVRLFRDLDYTISMESQMINIYTRCDEGDRIVFEAEYIQY